MSITVKLRYTGKGNAAIDFAKEMTESGTRCVNRGGGWKTALEKIFAPHTGRLQNRTLRFTM